MSALKRRPFSASSTKMAIASAITFLALAVWLAWFDTSGLSHDFALVIISVMLIIGLALFGGAMLVQRKERPLVEPEVFRPHADMLAGFRWRFLLVRVTIVLGLAPWVQWSMTAGFDPTMKFWSALPAILFFLGLQTLFRLVSGSVADRGIDDELTESFRTQAWRLGFTVLLVCVSIAYILSYFKDLPWSPPALSASIPYALAIGASAAAVKFAWLERASAKDG